MKKIILLFILISFISKLQSQIEYGSLNFGTGPYITGFDNELGERFSDGDIKNLSLGINFKAWVNWNKLFVSFYVKTPSIFKNVEPFEFNQFENDKFVSQPLLLDTLFSFDAGSKFYFRGSGFQIGYVFLNNGKSKLHITPFVSFSKYSIKNHNDWENNGVIIYSAINSFTYGGGFNIEYGWDPVKFKKGSPESIFYKITFVSELNNFISYRDDSVKGKGISFSLILALSLGGI